MVAVLASALSGLLCGCTPGQRERCMAARQSVVGSLPGSADVAYFDVAELRPRASIDEPIGETATASFEWIDGR